MNACEDHLIDVFFITFGERVSLDPDECLRVSHPERGPTRIGRTRWILANAGPLICRPLKQPPNYYQSKGERQ